MRQLVSESAVDLVFAVIEQAGIQCDHPRARICATGSGRQARTPSHLNPVCDSRRAGSSEQRRAVALKFQVTANTTNGSGSRSVPAQT
ncbi:MAG: hypothetical protein ACJ8KU_03820 [Chthoniobacterales bacterium]